MDNFAITAADAVSRRYKSNDPEAIIAQRTINVYIAMYMKKIKNIRGRGCKNRNSTINNIIALFMHHQKHCDNCNKLKND